MSWALLWASTRAALATFSTLVTFAAAASALPAAVSALPAAASALTAASSAAFTLVSTLCLVSSATFLASLAVARAVSALVSVSFNDSVISFNLSVCSLTVLDTLSNFLSTSPIFFSVSVANAVIFSLASSKALVVSSNALSVVSKPFFNSSISDLLLSTDVLRSAMVPINPGFWSSFGSPVSSFATSVIDFLTALISSLLLVFWVSSFLSSSDFASVIFSSTAVIFLSTSDFS